MSLGTARCVSHFLICICYPDFRVAEFRRIFANVQEGRTAMRSYVTFGGTIWVLYAFPFHNSLLARLVIT